MFLKHVRDFLCNFSNMLSSAVIRILILTMTMKWRPSGEVASMKTLECSTQKLLFPTTIVWVFYTFSAWTFSVRLKQSSVNNRKLNKSLFDVCPFFSRNNEKYISEPHCWIRWNPICSSNNNWFTKCINILYLILSVTTVSIYIPLNLGYYGIINAAPTNQKLLQAGCSFCTHYGIFMAF